MFKATTPTITFQFPDGALGGTPIADGIGTISVPASLLADYETAYPAYTFAAI